MECQAGAVLCGSDRLHCLFLGATESVVRLPVGHRITGWGDTSVLRQEVRYSSRGVSGPTPSPRRARTRWWSTDGSTGVSGCESNTSSPAWWRARQNQWTNQYTLRDREPFAMLYNFPADGYWIEGTSCQTTCRTQPDEFRLRWIQPQAVAWHPAAHDLDAVNKSIGELGRVITWIHSARGKGRHAYDWRPQFEINVLFYSTMWIFDWNRVFSMKGACVLGTIMEKITWVTSEDKDMVDYTEK